MRVIIEPAADGDMEAIGEWIAVDSPGRAVSFIVEIRARCTSLGDLPNAYPLIPSHENSGIRRCPFRDYLIFYRVTDESVEVLRVLYGARDIDSLLFPED
jgi:plasmid stabilization system protein ParE